MLKRKRVITCGRWIASDFGERIFALSARPQCSRELKREKRNRSHDLRDPTNLMRHGRAKARWRTVVSSPSPVFTPGRHRRTSRDSSASDGAPSARSSSGPAAQRSGAAGGVPRARARRSRASFRALSLTAKSASSAARRGAPQTPNASACDEAGGTSEALNHALYAARSERGSLAPDNAAAEMLQLSGSSEARSCGSAQRRSCGSGQSVSMSW